MTSIFDGNEKGIVAVTDAQADIAGAVVLWRLGNEVSIAALADAWRAAGLDEKLLPNDPTPAAAMVKALREHDGTRVLVRPLGRDAWSLVNETVAGETLTYEQIVTVKLVKDVPVFDPPNHPIVDKLHHDFEHFCQVYTLRELSLWVTERVRGLKAVALRDTGGAYFIPRDGVPFYAKMREILGGLNSECILHQIPAMQSKEAIAAILCELQIESDAEIAEIEKELGSGEELGKRAIGTRVRSCDALREKIESYERLLGQSLTSLHSRLETLQGGLTAAALASDGLAALAGGAA